jgi:hypothetical protein
MILRTLRALALAAVVIPATAYSARPPQAPPFTIAQLQYEGGGDWYANPSGLPNLLRAIRERTALAVADAPGRTRLTDPDLWSYPFLYMTGHGNVRFSDEEVRILRRYLLDGGFLHVDDNYGLDESFRREIRRVFPDRELQELPSSHPVFHVLYEFPDGLPKIHRHDGSAPQAYGIFDEGRLVVFYSYESDLGNGWEDPDKYDDPPETREAALRMGVNLFLYALSQAVS